MQLWYDVQAVIKRTDIGFGSCVGIVIDFADLNAVERFLLRVVEDDLVIMACDSWGAGGGYTDLEIPSVGVIEVYAVSGYDIV